MKLLLDTCIFLWFISKDDRLGEAVIQKICDPNNEVFLSVVSVWEVIVKHQIGKLPLPESPDLYLAKQRKRHSITSLALDEMSVTCLSRLSGIHRDPFDRMLVCQAMAHDLTVVTTDRIIQQYPIKILEDFN